MSLATDRPLVNVNRPAEVSPLPERSADHRAAVPLRFQQWVERLRPALVRLAYRYLWNAHDAEEIVQDTIALAWREVGADAPGAPRSDAWLYRVTINLALNRLRRLQAGPLPPADIEADSAEPGAEAETDELVQRMRLAIRELPDRQQAAIVLRDIEGLAYAEVAAIMEISAPSVRVLVHRAREAMRQILLTRWPDTFGPP